MYYLELSGGMETLMYNPIKKCVAVLLCAATLFVTCQIASFASNALADDYVSDLKDAWTEMYTETRIADLNTKKVVGKFATSAEPSTIGFTFNADNTVDKTAVEYDDKNIGLGFCNKDQDGNYFFDNPKNNRGVKYADVFVDDKYDTLSVTLQTGTVTTAGRVYLLCTYGDYTSTRSKEIEITADDSKKSITLDTKTLFGKKLSELLTKERVENGTTKVYDLKIIKIGFSKDLAFEGANISELNALNYVKLPEGSDKFSAIDWYNAALEVNTAVYKNTENFTAALKALGDYLAENDDDFTKNELINSWRAMYTETKTADLNTSMVVSNFAKSADLSAMGITLNDDNTLTKTPAEYEDLNTGMIFKNSDNWGSFWFDNSTNNHGPKYADVFNDANYDTLRVTFKAGTVTAAGKAYLLCTYSDYNSVKSQEIEIGTEDSGKEITLDAQKLFGKKLSELLTKGKDKDNNDITLKIIKVGFSKNLGFENSAVSELNALKYAQLPENSDNFSLLDWYNAAVKFNTAVYKNTEPFAECVKNLKNKLFTPEEIAVQDLKAAWGKMYTNAFFATLYSSDNLKASDEKGVTVNSNAAADAGMLYATGDEIFSFNKPKGIDFTLTFYDRGGKYRCLSLYEKIAKYDTITVSIYTGTVKNPGTVDVCVVDYAWKTTKIPINLKPEDSNKWIEIDVLTSLGFGSMKEFVEREDEKQIPSLLNLHTDGTLEADGMTVGMVAGRSYPELPDGNLSPKQLLTAALELDTDGYLGTEDFDTALNALYKVINGKDLPNLPLLDFTNSEADMRINVKRLNKVDEISVSGVKVGRVPVKDEIANWISDKGFSAIGNTFSVDLVDENSKPINIGERSAEITFNLPVGVNANEVNLLEIDGDNFKLVNCVYYEDKLVFDTNNFTNGKSYAIFILS